MNIFFTQIDITSNLYDDYIMIIPEKNILDDENNVNLLINSFTQFQGSSMNYSTIKLTAIKTIKNNFVFSENDTDIVNNFILKNNIIEDEYYIIKGPILSMGLVGFMLGVQIFKNYNFFIKTFEKILRYQDSEISMIIIS